MADPRTMNGEDLLAAYVDLTQALQKMIEVQDADERYIQGHGVAAHHAVRAHYERVDEIKALQARLDAMRAAMVSRLDGGAMAMVTSAPTADIVAALGDEPWAYEAEHHQDREGADHFHHVVAGERHIAEVETEAIARLVVTAVNALRAQTITEEA